MILVYIEDSIADAGCLLMRYMSAQETSFTPDVARILYKTDKSRHDGSKAAENDYDAGN